MSATIVDVGALWQTIWTAALAGLLVTVSCSTAVLGAARAQEHRGTGGAGRWAALGLAGAVVMVLVVVYGLLLVVDK